ncbi:MAG: hypothetical protein ICV78_24760 [Tolypothrix sp. Co-bin9]|nr:hypothetical protein [Tolypothrix sp. Co-bin9]
MVLVYRAFEHRPSGQTRAKESIGQTRAMGRQYVGRVSRQSRTCRHRAMAIENVKMIKIHSPLPITHAHCPMPYPLKTSFL